MYKKFLFVVLFSALVFALHGYSNSYSVNVWYGYSAFNGNSSSYTVQASLLQQPVNAFVNSSTYSTCVGPFCKLGTVSCTSDANCSAGQLCCDSVCVSEYDPGVCFDNSTARCDGNGGIEYVPRSAGYICGENSTTCPNTGNPVYCNNTCDGNGVCQACSPPLSQCGTAGSSQLVLNCPPSTLSSPITVTATLYLDGSRNCSAVLNLTNNATSYFAESSNCTDGVYTFDKVTLASGANYLLVQGAGMNDSCKIYLMSVPKKTKLPDFNLALLPVLLFAILIIARKYYK